MCARASLRLMYGAGLLYLSTEWSETARQKGDVAKRAAIEDVISRCLWLQYRADAGDDLTRRPSGGSSTCKLCSWIFHSAVTEFQKRYTRETSF